MTRNEYYGNLMLYKKNHKDSLEHSSSLLNRFMENTKYYKRIGQPGKYRYFYTKEEYDAYANNEAKKSGAAADASREAKERNAYERNKLNPAVRFKQGIDQAINYNKNKQGDNKNYDVYKGHKDNGTAADAASREDERRLEYAKKNNPLNKFINNGKNNSEGNKSNPAERFKEGVDAIINKKKAEEDYKKNEKAAKVNKYAEIARNSSPEAAAKEFVKEPEIKAYIEACRKGIDDGIFYVKYGNLYSTPGSDGENYWNNTIKPMIEETNEIVKGISNNDANVSFKDFNYLINKEINDILAGYQLSKKKSESVKK